MSMSKWMNLSEGYVKTCLLCMKFTLYEIGRYSSYKLSCLRDSVWVVYLNMRGWNSQSSFLSLQMSVHRLFAQWGCSAINSETTRVSFPDPEIETQQSLLLEISTNCVTCLFWEWKSSNNSVIFCFKPVLRRLGSHRDLLLWTGFRRQLVCRLGMATWPAQYCDFRLSEPFYLKICLSHPWVVPCTLGISFRSSDFFRHLWGSVLGSSVSADCCTFWVCIILVHATRWSYPRCAEATLRELKQKRGGDCNRGHSAELEQRDGGAITEPRR